MMVSPTKENIFIPADDFDGQARQEAKNTGKHFYCIVDRDDASVYETYSGKWRGVLSQFLA